MGAESVGCGMDSYGCGGWQSLVNAGCAYFMSCLHTFAICPILRTKLLPQVFTGILAVSLVALGAWYGV